MDNYSIINLQERPALAEKAADWFHEKWGYPLEAYQKSIEASLKDETAVPQWYVALADGQIIGGMGVIENDYHNRPDLTPNVCAVYVEEAYRCNGIAGALLKFVCADMAKRGIPTLYLLTDHTGFYERYDWKFFEMVLGNGEDKPSRMYIHRA